MIYYPPLHRYDSLPLPVLLLTHASGFSDCYDFNSFYMDTLCKHFAMRGFVTFNVEYRRGRIKDTGKYTSVQHVIAMYRGDQDIRGAIRSVIKLQRNQKTLKLPFQLDTNRIFIGGASAGAMMSLNAAYYRNQKMIDSIFPVAAGTPMFKDILGPINANYYYGDTNISYLSKIKGVLSMWGGTPIPLNYENNQAAFFKSVDSTDNPPMIGFHGLNDPVFPISGKAKQRVYFSPPRMGNTQNYNSESYCLTGRITLDSVAATPDIIDASALNMYNILNKLGRLTEFYEDCNMGHGLEGGCDTCTFLSDFGTGSTNGKPIWLYIAQRTATFFQAVMNNATPGDFTNSSTKFVDCENKRVKCNYANNNNGCRNTDTCGVIDTSAIVSSKKQQDDATQSNKDTKIILYPNPVKDVLKLKGVTTEYSVQISIIDMMGTVLFTEKTSTGVFTKNVSRLSPGIYYIKIQGRQRIITIPFLKE